MATGEALCCKLKNLLPIEGADKIQQANLFGETIIISKDYKEGQLGLLFDCESFLSEEYCQENNLYRHANLNKDKKTIGYLEDSKRIKPIRLRGIKCSALFMPIESLNYISKEYPKEGVQIKEWMKIPICDKYERPIKQNNRQQKPVKRVQKVLNFAEHIETDQLLRNLHKINIGDKIIVTSKLHGCSARVGMLPCIDLSWKGRLLKWLGLDIKNKYKFVVGSRHCLKHIEKDTVQQKSSFYEKDIWTESAYKYFYGKLIPGETIYYEIVGFLPSGASIMPTYDNKKLKNFLEKDEYKKFIERFGETTTFSYGCNQGEYKIFVYRITLSSEFGHLIDYSWEQVKRRSQEMTVEHVPEKWFAQVGDGSTSVYYDEEQWKRHTEQNDPNFPTHLNEGICVRIENQWLRPEIFKNKRYTFKVLEGIIKDTADFADIEESN